MTTDEAREAALGFVLEERAGTWCIVEDGGGVRPASDHEIKMWSRLAAIDALGGEQ